jgi:hypothetical protein
MPARNDIMILHLRHARGLERDEGRVRARAAGEEANELYPGQPWNEVEPRVAGDWRRVRGGSPLSWAQVREDAHSAWQVAWLEHGDCLRDHAQIDD